MLDFSKLMESESKEPVVKQVPKINLGTLLNLPKKLSVTETKLLKEELHKIEPGYKEGTAAYRQVSQWCENCNDVYTHVMNSRCTKLRCLNCKKDKLIKL